MQMQGFQSGSLPEHLTVHLKKEKKKAEQKVPWWAVRPPKDFWQHLEILLSFQTRYA